MLSSTIGLLMHHITVMVHYISNISHTKFQVMHYKFAQSIAHMTENQLYLVKVNCGQPTVKLHDFLPTSIF